MAEQANKPKAKFTTEFTLLPTGRWEAKRGKVRIYFIVSPDFRITFMMGPDDIGTKSFVFENSDSFTLANVSKLMNATAWHVVGLKKAAEEKAKSDAA